MRVVDQLCGTAGAELNEALKGGKVSDIADHPHVQHRLRQKGPRQRGAILRRPAPLAPAVGQRLLHPDQFQYPDQPLVALAQRPQCLLQLGEQLPLKPEPVS